MASLLEVGHTDMSSNAARIVSVQPPSKASRGEARPTAEQRDSKGTKDSTSSRGTPARQTVKLIPINPT